MAYNLAEAFADTILTGKNSKHKIKHKTRLQPFDSNLVHR